MRRWLERFGPGTLEDVQWWLGATKGHTRAALAEVGAVEVALEGGGTGWLLSDDLEPVTEVGPWAALLPTLDPTTMGWKSRDWYLDPAHRELLASYLAKLEALIGAIYLDAGMDVARERVIAWLANELQGLTLVDTNKDPKTRLQEFLQSRACELPRYEVVDIQGEPHCRTFFVECQVALLNDKTHGQGASRRIAEQVAAAAALIALGVENGHD